MIPLLLCSQTGLQSVAESGENYGLVGWTSTGINGMTLFGAAIKYGPFSFGDSSQIKIIKEVSRDTVFRFIKNKQGQDELVHYEVKKSYQVEKKTKPWLKGNLSVGYQYLKYDLNESKLTGEYNTEGVYLGMFFSSDRIFKIDDNIRPYIGFSITFLNEKSFSTNFTGSTIDSVTKVTKDYIDKPSTTTASSNWFKQIHLGLVIYNHILLGVNYSFLTIENMTSKDKNDKSIDTDALYVTRPPNQLNIDNLNFMLGFSYSF
ncbi:MAG: hypothetical protein J0M25_13680 [Flavobacteriales bacterium]|nr:hypothetical protein [Flavobacteriales bacterium]